VAYYNENFIETRMAPSTYTPVSAMEGKSQSTIDYINDVGKDSYYTLSNPVVQDVYITCNELNDRMFPEGATCAEKPFDHLFTLYKKYAPFGIEDPVYYDKDVEYKWCNSNA